MSYTFVSAIGLRKTPSSGWQSINPTNILLTELLTNYASVYIKLSNTLLTDPIVFNLIGNRQLFNNPTITFGAWLTANGNTVLASVGKDYSVATTKCHYGDAAQCNYKFKTVHPTAHPDLEVVDSDKTDLLLTKGGIDYLYMASHSLISLNGYFHVTDGSSYGTYVRNGRATKDISNDNLVGVLSFSQIAALKQIPITDDMIFKHQSGDRLYDQTFIDIGETTANKTVLLSIGGYLHVLDQCYREAGDGLMVINWNRIPIAERLFESRKHIDLTSLNPYFYNGSTNALTVDGLHSDGLIRAYLTLPQSFVIVLDAPILNVKRTLLGGSTTPGVYESYSKPNGLLTARYGSVLHYHQTSERGRWMLKSQPMYDFVYTFQTTDWLTSTVVTDATDPNRVVRASKATLIEVSKETITFTQ